MNIGYLQLFFDSSRTTESLERYCSGGYHPVVIGDWFDSRRYRILHKLGHGSYATVWLARDTHLNTYVALKISTAESSDAQEARMLQKLAESDSTHILSLHHEFMIDGRNGTHHVLVTDVVAPLSSFRRRPLSPRWRKAAARGLVLGVAQMHRCGVKHGDLHLGNLGCTIPELADQAEADVIHDLDPWALEVVLTYDHGDQKGSLPPYVVESPNLAAYSERIRPKDTLPDVRILDLGNARHEHEVPSEFSCVSAVCSPEVAFARVALDEDAPVWGFPHDVWSVGATIYQIVSGETLFQSVGMGASLLQRMAGLAGTMPADWESYWESGKRDGAILVFAAQSIDGSLPYCDDCWFLILRKDRPSRICSKTVGFKMPSWFRLLRKETIDEALIYR